MEANLKKEQPANGANYTGIGSAVVDPKLEEEKHQENQEQQMKEEDHREDHQGGEESEQVMEEEGEHFESSDADKSHNNPGQQQAFGTTTRSGGGTGATQAVKKLMPKSRKPQGMSRKRQFHHGKKINEQGDILSQIGDEIGQDQAQQFNSINTYSLDYQYHAQVPRHYPIPKQRFLYKPFMPLPLLQDYLQEIIEVRIYSAYLTKFNKAYIKRNFYGTDIYTSDSDPVCILQHVNAFRVGDEEPKEFEAISVYFRVVKGRNNYPSSQRYGIRSRKMGQFDGHSIKYESIEFLKNMGSFKDLYSMSYVMPTRLEPFEIHNQRKQQLKNRIVLSRLPDTAYKAITPAMVFNLSLEPALQFSLSTFADKSEDLTARTCQKLQDNILIIETDKERYEICKQAVNGQDGSLKYKFSLVKEPFMKDNAFMQQAKRPLEDQHVTVIAQNLDWSEFQWGEKSVIVQGQRYSPLKNYKYYAINEKKV